MLIKKLIIAAAIVGSTWWIFKRAKLVESDIYSNNDGGLIKAAYEIASGDLEFMDSVAVNAEKQISSLYLGLLKQMENGVKKGWNASKNLWFPRKSSLCPRRARQGQH